VPDDTLTITIDDLGNTDILNRDGDDGTGVPARTRRRRWTIIVNPKQDTPEIAGGAGTQVVDEDTVLELPAFEVFDVDVRSRTPIPNDFEYDPDWQGTVTITVLYGTVWLDDAYGVDYTGHQTREITLTGGLDALNNALRDGNVRYQGDPDFNSRNWLVNPTDNVPNDTLTITIDDLGNTDILNRDGDDDTRFRRGRPGHGDDHRQSQAGRSGDRGRAADAGGGRRHGAGAADVRGVRRGRAQPSDRPECLRVRSGLAGHGDDHGAVRHGVAARS
jgi:hypothetical protein